MFSNKSRFIFTVVFAALFLASATAWSAPRVITVIATEFKFEPSTIKVKAGETVTIKFLNQSKQKKEHELMIGRKVKMGGPFKNRPDGYQKDFFDGIHVKYMAGMNVKMVMAGGAKLEKMGKMKMAGMKKVGMKKAGDDHGKKKMKMGGDDHSGFMVQLFPKGDAAITFTVPKDKVGEWEIGCFSEDGTHYKEKMRGKLIVTN